MASTVFVDFDPTTPIVADWLNDVNTTVYETVPDLILNAASQWVASNQFPSFIDGSTFSISGDQTEEFHIGRRLQFTLDSGSVYGNITASVFSVVTTVSMQMDFGTPLDSTLSEVNLSILRADHLAIPSLLNQSFAMDGASVIGAKGVSLVAAATTSVFGNTDGNIVDITGNTSITSFGTSERAGYVVEGTFTGTPLLVQSANLNLNAGGNNIQIEAGDHYRAVANTTSQIDVTVTRKSGRAVVTNVPTVTGTARNLIIANNAASPNTQVNITASEIILKNSGGDSFLASSVNLTANIAAAGVNGLDTGTEANSTWYYIWVIYNSSTATVASLLSTSATVPTLPSGYTFSALMGAIYNSSAGNFIPYYQANNEFWVGEVTVSTTVPTTSYTSLSLTLAAPPIAKSARISSQWRYGPGLTYQEYYSPANTDLLSQTFNSITGGSTTTAAPFDLVLPLITAQTIYVKRSGSAPSDGSVKCTGGSY